MLTDLDRQYLAAAERGDATEADRLAQLLDAETDERAARLTAPGALLASALYYVSQGIAVFPLKPRAKTPATRNGFHDATADPRQVEEWWRASPTANIGAPTGRTFDVIDVDGVEGIASIAPMMEMLRPTLLGTANTPRPGGIHLYVPVEPGRGNGAKVLPGCDYRGAGGYVVFPPSVTDDHGTGRRYVWLTPLTPPAAGVIAA